MTSRDSTSVSTGDEGQAHFGAIVAIERRRLPEYDRPTFEIVDGQQRLTTFSLLTAAVLKRADELLATLTTDQTRQFLTRFRDAFRATYVMQKENHKTTFVEHSIRPFTVTERDEGTFAKVMDGSPPEELDVEARFSEELLLSAYRQPKEGLGDLAEAAAT